MTEPEPMTEADEADVYDPAERMAGAAAELAGALNAVITVLERAHGAGLAIPAAAAHAPNTLSALALAWSMNANGQPIPPELRAALELDADPRQLDPNHPEE